MDGHHITRPATLTLWVAQSILAGMSSDDQNARTEQDLQQLEERLDELIHAIQRLREENRLLRSREEELVAERAGLIEKTELARNRVESMITRLKSMETNL